MMGSKEWFLSNAWTLGVSFDLGRWAVGPDLLVRDGWFNLTISVGPLHIWIDRV